MDTSNNRTCIPEEEDRQQKPGDPAEGTAGGDSPPIPGADIGQIIFCALALFVLAIGYGWGLWFAREAMGVESAWRLNPAGYHQDDR